jgi:DhnA family fructose-bisphosphate aldolase class Ia
MKVNIGKERRLKRIIQQDQKTVIVPMDHGVTIGPIQGITNMQHTINQLIAGKADAVLVHKGIAKRVNTNGTGLIVMLSGMSNLSPTLTVKSKFAAYKKPSESAQTQFPVHVNVGAPEEEKMLRIWAK